MNDGSAVTKARNFWLCYKTDKYLMLELSWFVFPGNDSV